MTIPKAFEQVMATAQFKDIAKKRNDSKGSHYRMLRSRYNKDTLKISAMVEVLIEFGYIITVKKGKEV